MSQATSPNPEASPTSSTPYVVGNYIVGPTIGKVCVIQHKLLNLAFFIFMGLVMASCPDSIFLLNCGSFVAVRYHL